MAKNARAIVLNIKDNVATALAALSRGDVVEVQAEGRSETIRLVSAVPMGHKFALCDLEPGTPVIKYGEPIGASTARVIRGEHVHVHNTAGGRKRGE